MTELETTLETEHMTTRILADVAASITELKANPMKVASSAYGEPVAVLNRNEPAFYCVPAQAYEMMMDRLEDLELLAIAQERESEETISVNIDEL
ncbi:StbD replicon stabilization protein (antitoxin to StbE) [Vibrio chagasii]|nr:StbD replicon stabilization protein (antitoxin to StbE) [Vibrio chagasii]CAH6817157.1 StbD replicon stabilization protein (antitoxin to StbE) [Vibrio chagasii]CAH6820727.1 StbD replicon stabilization protein (antitoxin to StbE) [Vibrio chagasii]CAH7032712.1 StbD replicon stabilization protein (antitoxin to StbE) [Vibrio chagasii]CAH7039017.1 StbD replicon stabilization protein (antitoxin to StbE) [Vibrio chagasii]